MIHANEKLELNLNHTLVDCHLTLRGGSFGGPTVSYTGSGSGWGVS
jgi:hypothetical protein